MFVVLQGIDHKNVHGDLMKKIKEYIANQLKEDKRIEQLSMQELVDPFKKK